MKLSSIFARLLIGICVLFLCLAVYTMVSLYFHITGGPLSSLEKTVHHQLSDAISRGERSLKLKTTFTSFAWDRLCFLYPYTSKSSAEEQLGLKLGLFDWPVWWTENDGFWTLIFVGNDAIAPVRIPVRTIAEPPSETSARCVVKESGYLEITSVLQRGHKFNLRETEPK